MIPAPESVRFATSVTPAPGQLTVLFINFIGFYTTLEGYLIRAGAYPQDRSTLRRPRGDAGVSANVYCNAVISCLSILSPRVAICQLHLSPPPPLHHHHPGECLVAFFPLFFSLLFFLFLGACLLEVPKPDLRQSFLIRVIIRFTVRHLIFSEFLT